MFTAPNPILGLGRFLLMPSGRSFWGATRTGSTVLRAGLHQGNQLDADSIVFFGGGKMAEAMITGLIKQNTYQPKRIVVSDTNEERRRVLEEKYGVSALSSSTEALERVTPCVAVFSVKPQSIRNVKAQIKDHLHSDTMILSIVAGVTVDNYLESLPRTKAVIRCMPNTPASVGEGITMWCCSPSVTPKQKSVVRTILNAFGDEIYTDDESHLDRATALSGSGPAYFFLILEAMIDAGVHMGLSRSVSQRLVTKTMLGSAVYALKSGKHAAELRNEITSPGGTSAAALYTAERGRFRSVIADSIWAAYNRSVELGNAPLDKKPQKLQEDTSESQ
eukprot:NODE_842_length_1157_cov_122.027184_g800_i0.p1 GENE.NODE_842_length_1157_cov_122.027184_g800_i0~~NODE_842_length_1157_cov_122.027184_g800_i0.p1  ORF type:complete len:334 (-),score=28.06 NODE_842_length_1157_cov_122.027184_g800_i0:84-1085(-)